MLPQLDYSTYPSQIFWLVLIFTFLYCVFALFIVPRLDYLISQRKKFVANNSQKSQTNYSATVSAEDKYKVAIQKANDLARDILSDNKIAIEELQAMAYEKLFMNVQDLTDDNKKAILQFKGTIKSDLKNEIIVLLGLYYKQLMQESIDDAELKKLEQVLVGEVKLL